MKPISHFQTTLLKATFMAATLFGATSCTNTPKQENTKDVAEDHNEAKFDSTSQKKDAEFLVKAAEINLNEIKLGELASTQALSADVKGLGKMLAAAHTTALNAEAALAGQKQITIPTSPTDEVQNAYNDLSKKAGVDFDKKYVNMMVDGHKDAINLFEKESNDGTDAEIKAWAAGMIPDLRKHLDAAMTSQKMVEKK